MKQDNSCLEAVLEVYGADTQRWPEGQRKDLLSLIERDEQARQLFLQAQALDGCLVEAKEVPVLQDVSKLAKAILAKAEAMPHSELQPDVRYHSSDSVRSQNPLMTMVLKVVNESKALLTGNRLWTGQGQAGLMLMAFCLVLGVFIGVNENLGSFVEQGFQLAFFDGAFDNGLSAGMSLEDVLMGSEVL